MDLYPRMISLHGRQRDLICVSIFWEEYFLTRLRMFLTDVSFSTFRVSLAALNTISLEGYTFGRFFRLFVISTSFFFLVGV